MIFKSMMMMMVMMTSLTVDSVDVEGSMSSFPSLPDVRQHEVPAKHLPVLLLFILHFLLVALLLPSDLQGNVQGQRIVPEIDKPAQVKTNLRSVGRTVRPTDRQAVGPEVDHVLHHGVDVLQLVAAEDQGVQPGHPAEASW